jgi:hypothetical protein
MRIARIIASRARKSTRDCEIKPARAHHGSVLLKSNGAADSLVRRTEHLGKNGEVMKHERRTWLSAAPNRFGQPALSFALALSPVVALTQLHGIADSSVGSHAFNARRFVVSRLRSPARHSRHRVSAHGQ